MARARNIKPGFFTNDLLGELPPLARLLFAGLWTICDREGRVEDRPKKIKAEVLPYDTCDADDLLQQLHNAGFVLRYTVDSRQIIQVVKWGEHQNPHVKEAESSLPAPDKHGARTVLEQGGTQPEPERAGLIPSSLIPDSKVARKRATSFDASLIELPQWLDVVLWAEWVAERRARGKPITERAAREQIKALDEYRGMGHSPERTIRHAIASGNQGLYPPPKVTGGHSSGAPVSLTVPSDAAAKTKEMLDSKELTAEERERAEEAARAFRERFGRKREAA